jgi:hypothetical protein
MEIKKIKSNISAALIIFTTVMACFTSCVEDDKEWGYAKIYMPQAAISNGGLDNTYPVPMSGNPSTQNYIIDGETNTLKILLGVYRSGLQELEAYSVKVFADVTATADAVANTNKGVALPSDAYALPSEVSVDNGQRENTFYLSVDLNKLIADYPDYAANQLVLVVGISDPTRYELNEELSKTTVVIKGSEFLPTVIVPIISGGDFADGSEQYWTLIPVEANFDPNYVKVEDGILKISFGAGPTTAGIAYYQPVNLTQGVSYRFSADFTASGYAVGAQFFIGISENAPVADQYYGPTDAEIFMNIDVWDGSQSGLREPVSGKMPQVAVWTERIDKNTGTFSPSSAGQYYIFIVAYCWGGHIGNITLDNMTIEEL